MAKKGGYQLQADLSTDEEFDEFLESPTPLLLEIYSEWCGPCLGMIVILKSIQAEVGVENLRLAICKSDTISYLKRFQRTSEPHWLFVLNRRALDIVIGINVPILLKTIRREVASYLVNRQKDIKNILRDQTNQVKHSSHKNRGRAKKDSEIIVEQTTYDITDPQPIEVERINKKEALAAAVLWRKAVMKEKARRDYFMFVTNSIIENLPYMGVTVFGPQVQMVNLKKLTEIADTFHISCKDRKIVKATREDFDVVNYLSKNPLSDDVLEYLDGKQLLMIYWRVPDDRLGQVHRILYMFGKECTTAHTEPPADSKEKKRIIPPLIEPLKIRVEVNDGEYYSDSDEDKENIENTDDDTLVKPSKSTKSVFSLRGTKSKSIADSEEFSRNSRKSERISLASQKSKKSTISIFEEDDQEEEQIALPENLSTMTMIPETNLDLDLLFGEPKSSAAEEPIVRKRTLIIPPIWVPSTHRTHAALIYKFFRNETKSFLPPDPVPIPPHVIMAFPAYKMKSLMVEADRFKDDVLAYGFFTSDEASEAKLIASSVEQYLTKPKTDNDLLVFMIAKKTSNTMLSFVTYGPTYVSPTTDIGQKESPKFFPAKVLTVKEHETELTEEVEIASKPQEEKKKKVKKLQPDASTLSIQRLPKDNRKSTGTLPSIRSTISINSVDKPSVDVEEYITTTVKFSDIVKEHQLPAEDEIVQKPNEPLTSESPVTSRNEDDLSTVTSPERDHESQTTIKKQKRYTETEPISSRAEGGAENTNVVKASKVVNIAEVNDVEIIKNPLKLERYMQEDRVSNKVIWTTEFAMKLPIIFEEEEDEIDPYKEYESISNNATMNVEIPFKEHDFATVIDTLSTIDEEYLTCEPPQNSMVSLTETKDSPYALESGPESSDEENAIDNTKISIVHGILFEDALKPSELTRQYENKAPSKIFETHTDKTDSLFASEDYRSDISHSNDLFVTDNMKKSQFVASLPTTVPKSTNLDEFLDDTQSVDFSTFVETLSEDVDNLVEETGLVEMAILIANLATTFAECLTLNKKLSPVEDIISLDQAISSVAVENLIPADDAYPKPAEGSIQTDYIDLFADFGPADELITTKGLGNDTLDVDSVNPEESYVFTEYTDLFKDIQTTTQSAPSNVKTPIATTKMIDMRSQIPDEQPADVAEASALTYKSVATNIPTERTAVAVGLALTKILGLLKVLTASQAEETCSSLTDDLFSEKTANARFMEEDDNSTQPVNPTSQQFKECTKDLAAAIPSSESRTSLADATITSGLAFVASFVSSFDDRKKSSGTSAEKNFSLRKSRALSLSSSTVPGLSHDAFIAKCVIPTKVAIATKKTAVTMKRPALNGVSSYMKNTTSLKAGIDTICSSVNQASVVAVSTPVKKKSKKKSHRKIKKKKSKQEASRKKTSVVKKVIAKGSTLPGTFQLGAVVSRPCLAQVKKSQFSSTLSSLRLLKSSAVAESIDYAPFAASIEVSADRKIKKRIRKKRR